MKKFMMNDLNKLAKTYAEPMFTLVCPNPVDFTGHNYAITEKTMDRERLRT
jgi:hypothetical protein